MRRISRVAVACCVAVGFVAVSCTGGGKESAATTEGKKPATWIADRKIVARAFIDDLGGTLPSDQKNNPVAKKLKELTGIEIEWQYTSGTSDRDVLAMSIAAGDLPDLIAYYLDDSGRPEFPIVLKAAREGMFTDVAPFMKESQIYKHYFEPGYLPNDSYNNVVFRPEFNGAAYIIHMRIPRTQGSYEFPYRGGMYIQKSIADALKVEPSTIKTQDQLLDLLRKIKAGNFKDSNGTPVYPLGPEYWGGKVSAQWVVSNDYFGVSSGFNIENGKVHHEAETDYVLKQIDFYRQLLAEGLINPEAFTMDSTRCQEVSKSGNSAIISNVHNFMDIFRDHEYLPVGPLNNWTGDDYFYTKGKSGYCAWSIPKNAKNPGEIVKFLDFLATKEGKLLWMYGIEGQHYDMVDGKPVAKKEMLDLMKADRRAANDTGVWMGGSGSNWLEFIGETDMDVADFGELNYGTNADPHQYDYAMNLYNYHPLKIKYYDGFMALSFLQELKDIEPRLKPLIDEKPYMDIRTKAIFAKSQAESRKIIENYREQLKQAGLSEFEAYLEKRYKEDPKSIYFR